MKKQSSSEKPQSSNRSHSNQSRHRHSSSVSTSASPSSTFGAFSNTTTDSSSSSSSSNSTTTTIATTNNSNLPSSTTSTESSSRSRHRSGHASTSSHEQSSSSASKPLGRSRNSNSNKTDAHNGQQHPHQHQQDRNSVQHGKRHHGNTPQNLQNTQHHHKSQASQGLNTSRQSSMQNISSNAPLSYQGPPPPPSQDIIQEPSHGSQYQNYVQQTPHHHHHQFQLQQQIQSSNRSGHNIPSSSSSSSYSSNQYPYLPSNQHHPSMYPQNYYQPMGPPGSLYPFAPRTMVSSYYPPAPASMYQPIHAPSQPQTHTNHSSPYDPVFLYPQSSIFASYLQLVPSVPSPQPQNSGLPHYRQHKHHNGGLNRNPDHHLSNSSYGTPGNQSPGIHPYYPHLQASHHSPIPPPPHLIDPYQSHYVGFPPSFFSIPRGPPKKPKKSGFALWVGNLPPSTTLLELCALFGTNDIQSIFLIQRTLCAFVNYVSEKALHEGKQIFETRGRVLKGNHLVVKIKTSSVSDLEDEENDYYFGNQSDQNQSDLRKAPIAVSSSSSSVNSSSSPSPALSTSSSSTALSSQNIQEPTLATGISSSKNRYFICKSLTVEDLQASAVYGLWATQTHNQSIFNEAFKNCDNVYLIFSANRGGEYFGYARMASEIPKTADKDLLPLKDWNWAQQDGFQDSPGMAGGNSSLVDQMAALKLPSYYTSPNIPRVYPTAANPSIPIPAGRIVDDSSRGTLFWEVLEEEEHHPVTPEESVSTSREKQSSKSGDEEDSSRRIGSSRSTGSSRSSSSSSESTKTVIEDPQQSMEKKKKKKEKSSSSSKGSSSSSSSSTSGGDSAVTDSDSSSSNNWTVPFRIEWLSPPGKTVPFYMVRHLHNPYNRNQPVKIARDGTEIEPSVGYQIISMFHDK